MPPFTSWSSIADHLKFECIQAAYEGKVVPTALRERVNALDTQADLFDDPEAKALFRQLEQLEVAPDFRYTQPNTLEEIRKLRPAGPRQLEMPISDEQLLDRFHGAWTGRSCGCALGKPVELICLIHQGRFRIKKQLERRGEWPLNDYFSGIPRDDDEHPLPQFDPAVRENITYMPADDDIHYTLIGLHVLEKHGPDFEWSHVANTWNSLLPYAALWTAEAQAITNYNLRNVRGRNAVTPSAYWTARHNNPYREWIGAQIRADGWAYCAAGNPEKAAEFAWRDAHWTHTANGVYGEMFIAAMIAAAFVKDDPTELVEIGLSEIPEQCRLAEAIRQGIEWIKSCDDIEDFMDKLEAHFGDLHPVHTVNNALICVASLFYGHMAPDQSVFQAVMCGLDTDCNGATVGSIVGAISGYAAYPDKLKAPLNDTIKPQMFGFENARMRDLAERTLAVNKQLRANGVI